MNRGFLYKIEGTHRFAKNCPLKGFEGKILASRKIDDGKEMPNVFIGVFHDTSGRKFLNYQQDHYLVGTLSDFSFKAVRLVPDVSSKSAQTTRASLLYLKRAESEEFYSGHKGALDVGTPEVMFRVDYGIGVSYEGDVPVNIDVSHFDYGRLEKIRARDVLFYTQTALRNFSYDNGNEVTLNISLLD